MIKFDELHQRRQKREAECQLTSIYPGCTSIQRMMFQYSLAKRSKVVANAAKVIQFPLSLCFAATAHRFQGQTVYKPNKSVCDFRTVFQAAQSYVMLSRVESLHQLFILGSLPDNKFYASHQALTELERLNKVSVNNNPPVWEQKFQWCLKIAALNCQSLKEKIIDLQNDPILLFGDIICVSETWQKTNIVNEELNIAGYELHLNSVGEGKGLATYFKPEKADHVKDITQTKFQVTKLSTPEIDIISVYRSQGANNIHLVHELISAINSEKTSIICGDFNLCFADDKINVLMKRLQDQGFCQLVKSATHIRGGHIDHVYSNHDHKKFEVDVMMYSPYYTSHDHDALCVTIRRFADL